MYLWLAFGKHVQFIRRKQTNKTLKSETMNQDEGNRLMMTVSALYLY